LDQIAEQYLLENGEYTLALKSGSGMLMSRAIAEFSVAIEAFFGEKENLQTIRKWLEN
jgi:hypothetical protein